MWGVREPQFNLIDALRKRLAYPGRKRNRLRHAGRRSLRETMFNGDWSAKSDRGLAPQCPFPPKSLKEGAEWLFSRTERALIRRLLVLAVLGALVVGAAWVLFRPKPPERVAWQGYAEADFVKVGPTQQGLLTAVHVARGDRCVKGRRCSTRTTPTTAPRAIRRAAVARRPRSSSPICSRRQADAKSPRRRPICATPRPRATRRRRILRRNSALLKPAPPPQQTRRPGGRADLRSAEAKVAADEAALAQAQAPMGRRARDQGAAGGGRRRARRRSQHGAMAARPAPRRRRRPPARSPTCSPGPAKRSPPARRSSRCCRPRTFSSASSFPSRRLRSVHLGDEVAFACDGCPADLDGDGLVHRAAGRIHAAGHLLRVDARQVRLPGRGAADAEQATSQSRPAGDRRGPAPQARPP